MHEQVLEKAAENLRAGKLEFLVHNVLCFSDSARRICLHFADLAKTEPALIEPLLALSVLMSANDQFAPLLALSERLTANAPEEHRAACLQSWGKHSIAYAAVHRYDARELLWPALNQAELREDLKRVLWEQLPRHGAQAGLPLLSVFVQLTPEGDGFRTQTARLLHVYCDEILEDPRRAADFRSYAGVVYRPFPKDTKPEAPTFLRTLRRAAEGTAAGTPATP